MYPVCMCVCYVCASDEWFVLETVAVQVVLLKFRKQCALRVCVCCVCCVCVCVCVLGLVLMFEAVAVQVALYEL